MQLFSGDALEEIVITATRQTDTVHSVPLTVTAITSTELQEEHVKLAEDLTTSVTSLRISSANSGGGGGIGGSIQNGATVAIRGISSTIPGASATTGIYIDDIPLQQREPLAATGGGAAFPLLFDLQRVEVLKGPQGTLYGGSSEGGTLRFITEQPSLTTSSLTVSAENSYTEQGDPSYEFAVSGGVPLDDGVAVHGAAYYRRDGGYIDHVSQFTGDLLAGGADTNSSTHLALHGEALFKFTPEGSMTLGILYQDEKYADSDNYWANIPQYQASVAGPGGTGTTLYAYGPYNMFGPYKSGSSLNVGRNFYTSDSQLTPILDPHSQSMLLPSLTIDYDFGPVAFKSVTAYNRTIDSSFFDTTYTDIQGQGGNGPEGGYNALPGNSIFIANLPLYNSSILFASTTDSVTQELRLSSSDPQARFRWVTGAFFDRMHQLTSTALNANFGDLVAATSFGASVNPPSASFLALSGASTLDEKQYALFGEGTFNITDQWRLIGGLRWTRDDFAYFQTEGGALFGGAVVPNADGKIASNAFTPKAGVQYVQNPDVNYYATATKGYRPGGVNPLVQPTCAVLVATDHVSTGPFGADSLWSYEAGSKVRALGGRMSVNAAVYYIDWKGVQTALDPGCGQSFALNGAKEVSKGVDFEGSLLVASGLTATLRSAYTNAKYVGSVGGGGGIPPTIHDGNQVPYTPHWQSDLILEYRLNLSNGNSAFLRGDGAFQSSVLQDSGPDTLDWNPANSYLPSAKEFGLRAGYLFKNVELSLFARNLTNSQDLLYRGGFAHGPGPSNCLNANCSAYTFYGYGATESTYRPRTIGLSLYYRK